MWTKDKPTKAGYYWFVEIQNLANSSFSPSLKEGISNELDLVEIFEWNSELSCRWLYDQDGMGLEIFPMGYWLGPIPIPSLPRKGV